MITLPLALGASGTVMVLCAILLFTDSGAAKRAMRERVIAAGDLRTSSQALAQSLIYVPVKQTLLLRVASLLGYQADLPAAYATSPTLVVPLSASAGFMVFTLSGHVIAKTSSIVVGLAVAMSLARFLFKRKSKTYTSALFKQIPDTMSLMLRAVRAGLPIAEAIRNVGRESMSPTCDEFARVAGETALGSPTEVAMRRMADRTKIQEYGFLAVILGLHAQTGGNLSETLENMADMVRRRVAMAAKSRALSAEGRLSAIVVASLPFIVGALTATFNPGYMNEFFTNPRGPTFIFAFVALLGIGLVVTHLLIQKSGEE